VGSSRVAVTGANGLVGLEAVLRLRAAGHEVLGLGRGASRLPGGAGWAEVDLGDGRAGAAIRAFRPAAVLHAGALTDVDACERDPGRAFRVNAEGTAEVARACADVGARLVAVSTDYVFDGAAGPYAEDDPPAPLGAYARSKLAGEEAALALAPGAAVARTAVVYSGRAGAKPTFATHIVERLGRGEPVKAFVDQWVSPTHAGNAAAMVCELLLDHPAFAGVLHAAGATVLDRVAFARAVAERFGLRGEIVPVRTADAGLAAPRPLRAGLSVARAAALLRDGPLALPAALDRFHAEWRAREGA
jgi:dTDP-4-dehydrorhamnose reductase